MSRGGKYALRSPLRLIPGILYQDMGPKPGMCPALLEEALIGEGKLIGDK